MPNGTSAGRRKISLMRDRRRIALIGAVTSTLLAGAVFATSIADAAPAAPAHVPAQVSAVEAVRLGSEGDRVAEVQQALVDGGWPTWVDGKFGPHTDRTVRGFQRANGLEVDGIVGSKTSAALGIGWSGSAVRSTPATPAPPAVQATPAAPASSASGPCAEFADTLSFFSPGWDVARMQQIMYRESRCQPGARNASGASGLLQIMPLHVPNLAPCGVYSASDLLDAGKNICSAAIVYQRAGGMSPWAL